MSIGEDDVWESIGYTIHVGWFQGPAYCPEQFDQGGMACHGSIAGRRPQTEPKELSVHERPVAWQIYQSDLEESEPSEGHAISEVSPAMDDGEVH